MNRDEAWLLNEKYQGERTEEFFADCERLKNGEPLAYVIGHIPFLDTTIHLTLPHLSARPLIPRPETEYWVNKIIADITSNLALHFRGQTPKMRVLDLCAGSGCIGVAVLKAIPESRVDFVEIDAGLHPLIAHNMRENGISEDRAHILGGDLFESVTDTYDYILSNPPYIDERLGRTDASVIAHEPHRALFAPDHGFALIHKILKTAPAHLAKNGTLVIEHEPEQVARIANEAPACGLAHHTQADQYDVLRYTTLTRLTGSSVAP